MWTKNNFIYASKIWGTSWLVTPFVIFIYAVITEYFTSNNSISEIIMEDNSLIKLNMIQIILIIYVFSFICSLPYWLLLSPLIFWINKIKTDTRTKKIIFSASALLLLHLLFSVVSYRTFFSFEGLPWYISILFGIWYYRLNPIVKQKELQLTIDDHLIV